MLNTLALLLFGLCLAQSVAMFAIALVLARREAPADACAPADCTGHLVHQDPDDDDDEPDAPPAARRAGFLA